MKNILFFCEKESIGEVVSQYLKVEYTFECDAFSDLEKAKSALLAKSYDLIFTPDKIDTEDRDSLIVAKELLNIVIDKGQDTTFVYTGQLDLIYAHSIQYTKTLKLDQLGRDFVNYLGITKEELEYIKLPEYVAVQVSNFYLLNNPCCDIFIRIKKKDGDQYVKRINADDEIDKEIIKKYETMNVDELYVKKGKFSALMAQIMNQSLSRLKMAHSGEGDLHEVSSDTFEITQNMLEEIGITPQTVNVARTSIKSMMKMVSGDSKLGALLKDLISNEGSYSYKRSYLI